MKICIIGLGYVGLPLALELGKHFDVVGVDNNAERVSSLNNGIDYNEEYSAEQLHNERVVYSNTERVISHVDFIIVTVPTPITNGNKPDLQPLHDASKLIGKYANFNRKPVIVYESTVYPGVTEEYCVPIIEEIGKVKCGVDFFVGYSPERVNPGDSVHTVSTITKVVSGMDRRTLDIVDGVYSKITKTYRASSIKVAEAAKVIENSQRDLNIAFVNELALIFDKLGIDTLDVLEAAGTKWNFLKFQPGLVGGHCISVDPYYLTYRAEDAGIISQVILAGRRVNDSMAHHIVEMVTRELNKDYKSVNGSNILILGATFKENCKDVRNSKVEDIIIELENMGGKVYIHDPYYEGKQIGFHRIHKKGVEKLSHSLDLDIVVFAVPHIFYNGHLIFDRCEKYNVPVIDLKGILPRKENIIRL